MNWLVCKRPDSSRWNRAEIICPIYTSTSKRAIYQWGSKKSLGFWRLLLALRGILVLPMGVKYFTQVFLAGEMGVMEYRE